MSQPLASVSLHSLADVELQSAMHFLSAAELIKLARCSRRTLQLASTPFAWKDTLLPLHGAQLALLLSLPSMRSNRFLRVAPVHFQLEAKPYGESEHNMLAAARALVDLCSPGDATAAATTASAATTAAAAAASFPLRLFSLDATAWRDLSASYWSELFASPSCLRHLRVLLMHDFSGRLDASILRCIAALPHLHTLRLHPDELDLTPADRAALALVHSDSITSLHVSECLRTFDIPSSLALLIQLAGPQLTALHLAKPRIHGEEFKRLFIGLAATRSLRIRHLTIERFDATANASMQLAAVPPADLRDGFAALTHLCCLTLIGCPAVDGLLAHVLAAPQLRHLLIQPSFSSQVPNSSSTAPSNAALLQLMKSSESRSDEASSSMHAQQLTVTIRFARLDRGQAADWKAAMLGRQIKRRYTEDAQLNSFATRFAVLDDVEQKK